MAAALASVAILALAGAAFAQESQGRAAGKTLDNLPDPTLLLTPGNNRPRPAPEGSPAPNPDPRNFEGVWWMQGYQYMLGPEFGEHAPLKPQYLELLKKRIRLKNAGIPEADASTQCFPHGMPRIMESPYPIEIVQVPGEIVFLHEVAHNVRKIYLDRPQPKNPGHTFLGHSTAHWEGDTLVVDTVGLNDRTFIDDEGEAHSDQERLTERYRKINGGSQIELIMTVADPVTLEKPYSYRRVLQWRPDIRPPGIHLRREQQERAGQRRHGGQVR
ncbi:MAG: hypothetical protein WDN45_19340 [Caulobacteraceae bacterium]